MDEPVIKLNEKEYPLQPSDPEIIPDSTYWPLALAFGTTLLLWGFLTSLNLRRAAKKLIRQITENGTRKCSEIKEFHFGPMQAGETSLLGFW